MVTFIGYLTACAECVSNKSGSEIILMFSSDMKY